MAELKKLTDKILEEAIGSRDDILRLAREKAKKIEDTSKSQAEAKYDQLVEKGKAEADTLKERLRSNAKLKARDNELKAKQETIAKVFESAIEDLKNIDDDKYLEYIKNNASFSDKSKLVVMKDKFARVKETFPQVQIIGDRFCETGFIELEDGIEKNFTFSTQMDYIKDEGQGKIARVLFE